MKTIKVLFLLAFLWAGQASAATCSVSEFTTLITDFGGERIDIPLVLSPGPTTQTVTAFAPTAVSNPFQTSTRFLWIYCDEVMHIQLGTSPATGLTVDDFRIPAGGFWIGIAEGEANEGTLSIAFCDADCSV